MYPGLTQASVVQLANAENLTGVPTGNSTQL